MKTANKKKKLYEHVIRGKWIYDGCINLEEMISRLKSQIEELEDFRANGVRLSDEISDDYGFLIAENKDIADKFEFHELEDEG